MSAPSVHDDWLSLIEISGPFLAVPVLKEAFPQGLEELDATKRKRLRQAYEEWREALELEDAQFAELHGAWLDEVLSRGLELDEDGKGDVLKRSDWCAANLQASLPEHGVTLWPNRAVIDEQRANKPLLLIQTYAQDVDLDATLKQDGWAATPADRMVQLCRLLGCRLGLVTNGERWMLVDAPVGAVTTFASWYARIWSQEPITLQAFVHLLGIRRFFVDESEQLPALFDCSLKFQDEVTDALGEQVRRAVEVLIQTLDKADQDRNRELLHDVKEPELYEAALTVMMRLVFLLSAEERGLLLMGDERYEANYALSTLRMQLRKESEEILERRWDAWSRLLAIFRAVFGGIEHENLRLPALGGSLFDPDRFPFLEGRAKGSNWRTDAAKPLPIDNRTVLLLLEAIQQFQGRTLSYRALDVEQIGYVYEGLLERTVRRTDEVTLELDATKSAKTPWIKLAELDSARLDGAARLAELLQERSGSSASRVRNDLAKPVDDTLADRLLTACLGDTKLRDRVKPYAHLLRTDPWGYPLVYPAGAFIVTTGSDRRETGTHYTPKSLTEAIVTETLTPVAYVGPAEGTPRDQWALKSPSELLDLKICDPAMGSGAFLVQTCRWLSDRVVEAWANVEALGKTVSVDGDVLDTAGTKEPLPRDSEARSVIARRLIAERCLYGVDLNPLAVELAKLSIWLVTLAKGRPFGFLDHNLRCGDSLLGIHRLDQLTQLSLSPSSQGQRRLFGENIELAVREAVEKRRQIREIPIRDIRDVDAMAHLNRESRCRLEVTEAIANEFIGVVIAAAGNEVTLEQAFAKLAVHAGQAIDGDKHAQSTMRQRGATALSIDLPLGKSARKPFHWPLEFPEIFSGASHGFDALVGNPPFITGKRISTVFGVGFERYLKKTVDNSKGAADICVYFLRRAWLLTSQGGVIGMIATKSIAEGDSRVVGLHQLVSKGGEIIWANPEIPWPGSASVLVSLFCIARSKYIGFARIRERPVARIGSNLQEQSTGDISEEVHPLMINSGRCSRGVVLLGDEGFILSDEECDQLLSQQPSSSDVVLPYLIGDDIMSRPGSRPSAWVINFGSRTEQEARMHSLAFERLERLVLPIRPTKGQIHEKFFWRHWDKRERFFASMRPFGKMLGCSFTTKHWALVYVDTNWVPSQSVGLFAFADTGSFALLQSTIHEVWARRYSGKLGQTLTYNLTRAFATFPFPAISVDESVGADYLQARDAIVEATSMSLTQIYNLLHDPINVNDGICRLREHVIEIDKAALAAYGWGDINLCHGFHKAPYLPSNDCTRFTVSESARTELLRRLAALNKMRHEEEAKAPLSSKPLKGKAREKKAENKLLPQSSFDFNSGSDGVEFGNNAPEVGYQDESPGPVIVEHLKRNNGWHAKSEVIAATGISDVQWSAAIAELVAGGSVERQGEKRGARYRIVGSSNE